MRLKEFSCIVLLFFTFPVWGQISISGIVTDAQGVPISYAEVYLKQVQRLETTDDNGRFSFDNVPGGKYTVVAFAYEYEVLEKELLFDTAFTFTIQLEKLQALLFMQEKRPR
jgi:Fe(3+) dicitrate transport protein